RTACRRRDLRHRYGAAAALRVRAEIRPLYRCRLRRKVRPDRLPRPARWRKHKRGPLRVRHSELVLMGSVSRWRTAVVTVIVAYGILILGGVAFICSGVYPIGADTPHWGLIFRVFETARVRSIKAHAASITAPAGLDDQAKILAGVEHFADHCA